MKKDPLIWSSIESELQRYMVFNECGKLIPDRLNQEVVGRLLKALRVFFHENGLLSKPMVNQEGELVDVELRLSDFTSEGIELVRMKVSSWLDSKGVKKNPPDMAILEKALNVIRVRG
jgi:hypothetical protein